MTVREGTRKRATAAKDTAALGVRLNSNTGDCRDRAIGRAVIAHHADLALTAVDLLARIARA